MRINKPILLKLLVLFVVLVSSVSLTVELRHHHTYGHFVHYGLHVDAQNEDFNIAIPGQTKMYWAEISNFSLLPVRLPACRPTSDTLNPPLEYAYAIQKFDEHSKSWQTVANATHFEFCPNPVAYTYLLPGSSLKVMGGGAFGAMDPFRKDDLARFVVFRQVAPSANWDTAIPSAPFRIEDDVLREPDGSFRTLH